MNFWPCKNIICTLKKFHWAEEDSRNIFLWKISNIFQQLVQKLPFCLLYFLENTCDIPQKNKVVCKNYNIS